MGSDHLVHFAAFEVVQVGSASWKVAYARLRDACRDPFFSPDFARAAQAIYPGQEIRCALSQAGDGVILYPFVRRRIATLLGLGDIPGDPHDVTGLYGRSGVLCQGASADALSGFHAAMARWAGENDVLCGFDRFHPVLENQRVKPPSCQVRDVGIFVVADLSPSWEVVQRRFSAGQRAAITQARRLGCEVSIGRDDAAIAAFDAVYRQTMDARQASQFYYFPPQFYRAMAADLGAGMQIVRVTHEGKTVSACLLLLDGHFCHYYLAGTDREAMKLRASQLAQAAAMQYAQQRGCLYYLMGGGLSADDGLSRYKLSFAPDGGRPSQIGFTVFDQCGLERLRLWMTEQGLTPRDRFQFYDLQA